MKWFEVPDNLIPKLRELQLQDLPDPEIKSEDAVMLFAGLGDPMYLTFDGRVIILDMLDEVLPREAVTLKEAATAIAAGAKVRKFPQLLSLLPECPSESEDCLDCETGGWLKLSETITIVCGHCGGLGWKQIEKGQLKWQNKK